MKTARCPICKKELAKRATNFPFCSARCKLVDAGNWFEGAYCVEAGQGDSRWGEN
ncbi:MAG: DNA gyrase inhibitor YacG [Deltaproteobacteria bacterium]|nr:DNA gyrase inhibitor YacG [Deltaproteobacteria bacterium]